MRKVLVMKLLADLHTHAADDPRDDLGHSAEMLIDAAAASGVQVLAITLHDRLLRSDWLEEYAEARGVMLMPGIELTVEGKHVVVLNPSAEHLSCDTFDQLRKAGRCDGAIMAPHPYFPAPPCLGWLTAKHIDLFDLIEYSSMYCTGINFNRLAVNLARKHGRPIVGTSDTHSLPYVDNTLTWVEADRSVESVIHALLNGRIELRTKPRAVAPALRFGMKVAYDSAMDLIGVKG